VVHPSRLDDEFLVARREEAGLGLLVGRLEHTQHTAGIYLIGSQAGGIQLHPHLAALAAG